MTGESDEVALVKVHNLVKHFDLTPGLLHKLLKRTPIYVHAVDGVTFSIAKNETFCIVGESGSGKSTLAMAVLRLIEPTSGQVVFEGIDVTKISQKDLRKMRKSMQVVFQDPSSSLDPRKKILSSVSEPLIAHEKLTKARVRERVVEALRLVGLSESQLESFPHQFSGGQRQRICIARALVLQPKFVVLDEPTSALDASVQSQILVLLEKLQSELSLSYLLVTHNISVARYLADTIAVMYLGKIVEIGNNEDILNTPRHPYTQLLISSVLEPSPETRLPDEGLEGEIPNAITLPTGCRFHTRCKYAKDRCHREEPELRLIGSNHQVSCHFAEEISSQQRAMIPSNLDRVDVVQR